MKPKYAPLKRKIKYKLSQKFAPNHEENIFKIQIEKL